MVCSAILIRYVNQDSPAKATQIEVDGAGRLLLPKSLMEHAGLEKDIVLVSAMDKLEIWDKNKYQQFFENFSPDTFSSLANEVMVKKEQ